MKRRRIKNNSAAAQPALPRVSWHQWSVVRLASVAMITVFAGYMTAAVLAVKSMDQLLHIVHDNAVEKSLKSGLDNLKDSYKTRQELLAVKLRQVSAQKKLSTADEIKSALSSVDAASIMRTGSWNVTSAPDSTGREIRWINRHDLAVGHHMIKFDTSDQEDDYRRAEEILQRYQVIGLELRERIRPALIKALSVTLAIMCALLLSAFVYMALRGKTRIQKLVQGFIEYAENDDSFRFHTHWNSELGLLSRQFNHMADDLDSNRARVIGLEKLASWQTIARKMAHEIKNPLTPIQIMIGQVKRHYDGHDEEFKNLLEKAHSVILEEVASLRRMVDEFSQFAQLPSPRLEIKDATQTVRQAIALAEGSYAPHVIRYEGKAERVEGEFDDQLIRLALHNLIKNAAEADPKSSSDIVLRLKDDASRLIFEVEDHGPGIPEHLKTSVFEAYVTTKHTGPSPGMGLGLAICQKVALEHKGNISVSSVPGKTIFKLEIPRFRKVSRP